MILITKKRLMETPATRFKFHNFYQDYDGEWKWLVIKKKSMEKIYKKLLELPKTATEKQILKAMGKHSYIGIACDQCEQEGLDVVVSLCGLQETSQTGTCLNCLKKAIALIEEKQ